LLVLQKNRLLNMQGMKARSLTGLNFNITAMKACYLLYNKHLTMNQPSELLCSHTSGG
jgi:hypothetical protein